MKIQIQWEFDLPYGSDGVDHDRFAEENGVPLIVDMCDYFEEPSDVSDDHITDALSDEFGWLIKGWEVIESCNLDKEDIIINHQEQPAPFMEDNVETISTPISSSSEESLMTVNDSTPTQVNEDSMITQLFHQFISEGGDPKVTEFKKHLNELINSEIKQLCGRSGLSLIHI